jgi:hypothetical protein
MMGPTELSDHWLFQTRFWRQGSGVPGNSVLDLLNCANRVPSTLGALGQRLKKRDRLAVTDVT